VVRSSTSSPLVSSVPSLLLPDYRDDNPFILITDPLAIMAPLVKLEGERPFVAPFRQSLQSVVSSPSFFFQIRPPPPFSTFRPCLNPYTLGISPPGLLTSSIVDFSFPPHSIPFLPVFLTPTGRAWGPPYSLPLFLFSFLQFDCGGPWDGRRWLVIRCIFSPPSFRPPSKRNRFPLSVWLGFFFFRSWYSGEHPGF